jgi:hypothetical protein
MADHLRRRTGSPNHVFGTVLADAGYASDANLAAPARPAGRTEQIP